MPEGADLIRKSDQGISEFPDQLAKFKAEEPELMRKYTNDLAAAQAVGIPEPRKPFPPRDPSGKRPGCLFNGMVAPVAVRYNWAAVADGNLYNAADLPASPFRTDVEPDQE